MGFERAHRRRKIQLLAEYLGASSHTLEHLNIISLRNWDSEAQRILLNRDLGLDIA
jgi:hypothetical protein